MFYKFVTSCNNDELSDAEIFEIESFFQATLMELYGDGYKIIEFEDYFCLVSSEIKSFVDLKLINLSSCAEQKMFCKILFESFNFYCRNQLSHEKALIDLRPDKNEIRKAILANDGFGEYLVRRTKLFEE